MLHCSIQTGSNVNMYRCMQSQVPPGCKETNLLGTRTDHDAIDHQACEQAVPLSW